MVIIAFALAIPLTKLFVGYDQNLYELTKRGFYLYSLSFILMGFNIFGASFFTSLNNGLISAIISFLRTLVFQIIAVLLLPLIFDVDGIWLSLLASEILSFIVTLIFLIVKRKKYQY